MASTEAVKWLIITCIFGIVASKGQSKQLSKTQAVPSFHYTGICLNMYCNSMESLMKLRNCTVVLGDLKILLMERTTREDFVNISFPELREVTGYMIMYRVFGLESIGQLFPNLGRIRGTELVYNFALIIYDLPDLIEIGLYGLLKVDRGGVIAWGGDLTCYVNTVRWELITNGRHVVFPPDNSFPNCNVVCSCSLNPATNLCWNNRKCQRFLEGPEAEKCDSQCFGCKKTKPEECSLCRFYTYRGQCVSKCPNGTIVLPVNKYCLTESECKRLGGWAWKGSCLFECPQDYIEWNDTSGKTTCKRCDTCKLTCKSLNLQTLANIQSAEKCVYINGSLTIHIRSVLPEALDEMRHFLSIIQEVTDYIFIYGSISITSLDFLSSLKRIKGRNLKNGKYSFIVSGMHNLQTLFTSNVTQNLIVDNGTLRLYDNPMLCLNQIDKLRKRFPQAPSEIDIPQGLNGYSGGCDEVSLQLRVEVKNETSAVAIFNRVRDYAHYTILYVRIPQGTHSTFVPEACSESEWDAITVPYSKLKNHTVHVEISSLRPASSYALCIETYDYDPRRIHLARSSIVSFNTTVGRPEPPFIIELVASSSDVIVIRWVDHKDYRPHITYYELDVSMIDISPEDIAARDHCVPVIEDPHEYDYSRHAIVMRPPENYEKGCESMCGILSTITIGAMTEEYFDVCSILRIGCDESEDHERPANSTFGRYVRSLVLNLSSPRTDFQIGNLAPFRDYRFKIRACTANRCSRSRSGVARTLRLDSADVPHINSVSSKEKGVISVNWRPPKVTNGPILAYNVEILPVLPDMDNLLPRVWCVPGNVSSFKANFNVAKKYVVKICSTTLGSNYICSSSRIVRVTPEATWWWIGLPFAVILYIGSLIIGIFMKTDTRSDEISLVDLSISCAHETEPPSETLSSEVPFYIIQLRESQ